MARRLKSIDPHTRVCGRCLAVPGQPCRRSDGRRLRGSHSERVVAPQVPPSEWLAWWQHDGRPDWRDDSTAPPSLLGRLADDLVGILATTPEAADPLPVGWITARLVEIGWPWAMWRGGADAPLTPAALCKLLARWGTRPIGPAPAGAVWRAGLLPDLVGR